MTTAMPPVIIYVETVEAARRIFRSVLGSATPDTVFDDRAVTISECPSSEVLGQPGCGFSGGLASSGLEI